MAYVAACTDKGVRKATNEDACCIEVADTVLGEMVMAIVCDGVGGLARGDLASSTVVDRFADWFEGELPSLVEGMSGRGVLNLDVIEGVWGALLANLNELIQAYGTRIGTSLGTTFTGILACGGRYVVGHVGDCRAYQMSHSLSAQITEDQTLVARKLAQGELTVEEAAKQPTNVILQSVGTESVLRPVFTQGSFGPDELFVICCDGAYRRAGNEGVRELFQQADFRDEESLIAACRELLRRDIEHGEKDNLTVICFSGDLQLAAGARAASRAGSPVDRSMPDARGAAWADSDYDEAEEPLTAVLDEEEDEMDLLYAQADAETPTVVESSQPDVLPDDLPTQVESSAAEDGLPTVVENETKNVTVPETRFTGQVHSSGGGTASQEDDIPTVVEGRDA